MVKCLPGLLLIAAASLFAGAFLWTAPVLAEIGVTAAVNPPARGTPPERDPRLLEVGTAMVSDERVQTGNAGRVQLLFVDGSALTVGPNSDMTLDRFVYDPSAKTGDLALSVTKGIFRFVGGRISKQRLIKIRTKVATIGIRGGVGILEVGTIIRVLFLYGDQLTIELGSIVRRLSRPGYMVEIVGGKIGPARPAPVAQVRRLQDSFETTAATVFATVDVESVKLVATHNSNADPRSIARRKDTITPAAGEQAALPGETEKIDEQAKDQAPQDPVGSEVLDNVDFVAFEFSTDRFGVDFDDVLNRFLTDLSDLADSATVAGFDGTATIAGDVIGFSTANGAVKVIDNSRFSLDFDFAARMGGLKIVDFDGRDLLFGVQSEQGSEAIYQAVSLIGKPGDSGNVIGLFTNQSAVDESELGTVGVFGVQNAIDGSQADGRFVSD